MTGKRAQRLEKLGMVRDAADAAFQENLAAARVYFAQHWTLAAPRSATALDRPVGQWLSDLRRPGALAGHPERAEALAAIDPDWNPDWPIEWQRHYAAVRELLSAAPGRAAASPRKHGGVFTLKKPDSWHAPETATTTDTTRYGKAEATAWNRMHPRLTHRGPWLDHDGELPLIHGTLILLKVEYLPGDRDPKPVWLWSSAPAVDADKACLGRLRGWMHDGSNPVLRVNAAGILAKVPGQAPAAEVCRTLANDHEARRLYSTAVTARVCGLDWATAGRLVADPCSVPTKASFFAADGI